MPLHNHPLCSRTSACRKEFLLAIQGSFYCFHIGLLPLSA